MKKYDYLFLTTSITETNSVVIIKRESQSSVFIYLFIFFFFFFFFFFSLVCVVTDCDLVSNNTFRLTWEIRQLPCPFLGSAYYIKI